MLPKVRKLSGTPLAPEQEPELPQQVMPIERQMPNAPPKQTYPHPKLKAAGPFGKGNPRYDGRSHKATKGSVRK